MYYKASIITEQIAPSTHLMYDILDPESVTKKNNLKEITNPVFFDINHKPTSDGLLSNEIFGITIDERANTFAYIDLYESFIDPVHYETWSKMDSSIKNIVHGTVRYRIDEDGYLVKDEEGETGIGFLRKNIDKIKIRRTGTKSRDENIAFIMKNKKSMFIRKLIVLPAYYRDVNNTSNGYTGVGEINKLYSSLIISVKALRESSDYGLTIAESTRGRIQETILSIYQWYVELMARKLGVIARANQSKTTDNAIRLVMSSAPLTVETMDDMMVTMDRSALPLSGVCAMYFPFVMFHLRRIFDEEFGGKYEYPIYDNGEVKYYKLKDPLIEFSDDRLKKELNRFIHGYSDRFVPIPLPIESEDGETYYLAFKGYNMTKDEYEKQEPGQMSIVDRPMTWCDVFYMAANEAIKDKASVITRYPIDSYLNQFPSKIIISTTKETEPMVINNNFYQFYPKIRGEDIGKDTSNRFMETCIIANPYIDAMGMDFDGDTSIDKGIYTDEANKELIKQIDAVSNYISLGGQNLRVATKEAIQSLYSLTLVLPDTKLVDPILK